MRIVIEIPTDLARRAFDVMDQRRFSSIDELATAAFESYFRSVARHSDEESTHQAPLASEASCRDLLRLVQITPDMPIGRPALRADAPWIWGMINRVFPLKLAVRACANLSQEAPVTLSRFQVRAANCAAELGAELSNDDRTNRRKRNESRAVGLPSGKDLAKSKVRYAMHFIGRRSGHEFVGGCFEAGLIGPVDAEGHRVAPTELGWEFAALPNPTLDRVDGDGEANLSPVEASFYLERVTGYVPSEWDAFAKILTAVGRGPLSPDELAKRVFPVVAPGVSGVVINTTRSGALGRLSDLGAIAREPVGRSATYSITERGRQALSALLSQRR
jgi:hypothetical protein